MGYKKPFKFPWKFCLCWHAWINQWFHNKSCPLWWPVSLSIRIKTTLNHIRLRLESARAVLCKWATCTRQLSFQKLSQTLSISRSNKKTLFGKRVMKRNHCKDHETIFWFVFTRYERQRNCFFLKSASSKRHCVTHWCEQRGMNSYQQWQIVVKL